jgi:hypothetical protein
LQGGFNPPWGYLVLLANQEKVMEWNRFDICEAWYIFLKDNNKGQFSYRYKQLSHLKTFFKPAPGRTRENLSENAKEILASLEAKEANQ